MPTFYICSLIYYGKYVKEADLLSLSLLNSTRLLCTFIYLKMILIERKVLLPVTFWYIKDRS